MVQCNTVFERYLLLPEKLIGMNGLQVKGAKAGRGEKLNACGGDHFWYYLIILP